MERCVSYPLHFDLDPALWGKVYPDPVQIQIRSKIKKIFIEFFSVKLIILKTIFFIINELIIHVYCVLNKKQISLKQKLHSYNFGWFLCKFITIFFWLPGSRSTFPAVDPDLDPMH